MIEISEKTYLRKDVHEATLKYFNGDELATGVWINKYCLKDSDGNLFEKTPEDMHRRLAKEFARIEAKYPNPLSEEEIFKTLDQFKRIVPAGSPMSGIGNDFQIVSLSNCFVIGNDVDSDSYGGIMKLDQEMVQLQKRRGGVGLDISFIRPAGTPVKNSAITSTGVVPFMDRYSNSTKEVAQDGRRGALMESISIKHPDAEAFIDAKMTEGKVTGANISVKLDNQFMYAAKNNLQYIQHYPVDWNDFLLDEIATGFLNDYGEGNLILNKLYTLSKGYYAKIVDAKKIWEKIIHNAWKKAEPGILFWDNVINESIPDCYADLGYKTVSTNPCLTDDNIIMTKNGPIKIKNLIGKQFNVYVDGTLHSSTKKGFFETGENKDVFEIETKRGLTIKSTDNHEFKQVINEIRGDKKFKWSELKDLQEGDILNINNNRGVEWKGNGNFEEGWLLGNLMGDGTFTEKTAILCYWGETRVELKKNAVEFIKNNLNHRNDLGAGNNNKEILKIKSVGLYELAHKFGIDSDKILSDKIENSSSDFHKGFISGYLDADGTVLDNIEKGINVRLSQSNLQNLKIIQRMLLHLGIFGTIYENRRDCGYHKLPDGNGGYRNYKIKSQHELVISKDNLLIFKKEINFIGSDKRKKLSTALSKLNRGLYQEKFIDTIKNIYYVGKRTVYDCQIPNINEFDANGISTHNCGEIPLCPNDSCRLLSVNLYGYIVNPFTIEAYFNTELFSKDVQIAQRYMDDIIDLEIEKIDRILKKIKDDPEDPFIKQYEINLWENIRKKTLEGRRTGLGVTGEGDMLAALGLTYGTDEANNFSADIHKTLKLNAYRSSVTMAKERNPFPIYNSTRELENPFIKRIADEEFKLYQDMVLFGRRNIALLTVAPTGTVSLMTQTTSGIEPVFLPVYKRRRKINPNDKDVRVDFVDDEGIAWMEYSIFHHNFETWLKTKGYDVDVVKTMSIEQIDEIIKTSPYYKATSTNVDWVKKVEMQGMIQKHVDHSISVTVNLPENVSEETVAAVYETGHKVGCKGITVYREGSRTGVLITDKEKASKNRLDLFKDNHAPKRPKRLKGEIHRFQNNLEKWVAVVGINNDRPYEIFTGRLQNGLKALPNSVVECEIVKKIFENPDGSRGKRYDLEYVDNSGERIILEGISHTFNPEYWNYAKMISSVLRHGMPMAFVFELIDSLNLEGDHLNTWKNGIARVIKRYIKDGEKGKGKCPICQSTNLEFKEGCLTCMSCGHSKCG